jgi:SAM-dependent methyltransferase
MASSRPHDDLAAPHDGSVAPREPDDLYANRPPWDIGRPQSAVRALADAGAINGRVLDAGCGTGEHTLMAAALGLDATGIDLASNALRTAEHKARVRGLAARFRQHDARRLAELGESFDTVLDCGLFHAFRSEDRTAYVAGLHAVLRPGGHYLMLCFSDQQTEGDWWPHRVSRDEITDAFADGWRIDSIDPATIEILTDPAGVRAWQVAVTRNATPASQARVATDRPVRYLDQLLRHAGHMRGHGHLRGRGDGHTPPSMQRNEDSGTITTTEDALILRAEAATEQDLRRIQDLVGGRLEKIGRRDRLTVEWIS